MAPQQVAQARAMLAKGDADLNAETVLLSGAKLLIDRLAAGVIWLLGAKLVSEAK